MVVRGGDVLDAYDVADLRGALSDAKVVDADHHQVSLDVVRRLAVSAVSRKLHVEVAPRVPASGHREHHRLMIGQPFRCRQERRRNDGESSVE
jgi:hypothetical protein